MVLSILTIVLTIFGRTTITLMSGMMIAMASGMIIGLVSGLLFITSLAIMFLIISIAIKVNNRVDKWYGKITHNPVFMITTLGLVLLLSNFGVNLGGTAK